MSCPHPNRDCYECELKALDQARTLDAEVVIADEDCKCGCGQVLCEDDAVRCLGCSEVSS